MFGDLDADTEVSILAPVVHTETEESSYTVCSVLRFTYFVRMNRNRKFTGF